MNVKTLWILFLVLDLTVVGACSGPVSDEVSLGQEFSLSLGQSTVITSEDISIKFVEVVADNRCPQGAVCVWEGEASSLVEITISEVTSEKVLIQSGAFASATADFRDYEISFNLQPYPELDTGIEKGDYCLALTVSKK